MGYHAHSPGVATEELVRHLQANTAVRSFGSPDSTNSLTGYPLDRARMIVSEGRANTIFFDPYCVIGHEGASFIADIRNRWPNIVFSLYTYVGGEIPQWMDRWLAENPRFTHYFRADYVPGQRERFETDVMSVLDRCQEWHVSRYDFDVVVSFAGVDRHWARVLSHELVRLGARVFFDEYFRHELLGKDLYVYLHEAYSKRARYCVVLLSEAYLETVWTQHELRSAQERALRQNRIEYLLPLRLDPVSAPGLASTTGYLDVNARDMIEAARIVAAKLWPTSDLALTVSGLAKIPKMHIT